MNDRVATRAALLEMRDERHSMREGYTFLDEKCLLLAGAMLRELHRFETLWHECTTQQTRVEAALGAALGRHGLEGLALYPLDPASTGALTIGVSKHSVMGVALLDAAAEITLPRVFDSLLRTPEADACARAHADLLRIATELAASSANLERLLHEYRRSSRRARALDGVLLPELDHDIDDMALKLEEQERDEAIAMRPRSL
jgi:V/A-type H+-transporting ATPase subunit D